MNIDQFFNSITRTRKLGRGRSGRMNKNVYMLRKKLKKSPRIITNKQQLYVIDKTPLVNMDLLDIYKEAPLRFLSLDKGNIFKKKINQDLIKGKPVGPEKNKKGHY